MNSARRAALLLSPLLAVLLAAGPSAAATVVLNFDNEPNGQLPAAPENGTPIPIGTQINELFQYVGVTFDFDHVPGAFHVCSTAPDSIRGENFDQGLNYDYLELTNEVYSINAMWPSGNNATQVISPCPAQASGVHFSDFPLGFGYLRATFDRPVTSVCLTSWRPVGMKENANAFLEATEADGDKFSVTEDDPCINGEDIVSVRFAGADGVFAVFDDMIITYDSDLIDFDIDPFGYVIDGSDTTGPDQVSFAYEAVGVELVSSEFGTGSCGQSEFGVFAREYPTGLDPNAGASGFPESAPNAVNPFDTGSAGFTEDEGWVEASFENTVDGQVCIDGFTESGTGEIQMIAIGTNGQTLDDDVRSAVSSEVRRLCLNGQDIKCVRFTGSAGSSPPVFLDNLSVEGLPEPGAAALAAASLLTLAGLRRHRATRR